MASRPIIVGRLLRIALAASLLLSGSFHFHASDSAVERWDGPDRGFVLRSAISHPTAPLHVESVAVKRAPQCLECLLRQKNHALGSPSASQFTALEPGVGATLRPPAHALVRRAEKPGQPRGPPLS